MGANFSPEAASTKPSAGGSAGPSWAGGIGPSGHDVPPYC